MDSSIIYKHFPGLNVDQKRQIEMLGNLYKEWNSKINVVSRKDIDNLYERHVLHSLAIAMFLGSLKPGTTLMDIGTGGGFPGIPLAIFYPECRFHLIDRIGKKIKVAQAVADATGLHNVSFQHGDVGECHEKYNYVVSRAVMPLNDLWRLVRRNIAKDCSHPSNRYANGLVCLKGADIQDECQGIKESILDIPLNELIDEPHFHEKAVIYIPGA